MTEFRILAHYFESDGQTLRRWMLYRGVELVGQFTSRDAARQFLAKAKRRPYVVNLDDALKQEGVT